MRGKTRPRNQPRLHETPFLRISRDPDDEQRLRWELLPRHDDEVRTAHGPAFHALIGRLELCASPALLSRQVDPRVPLTFWTPDPACVPLPVAFDGRRRLSSRLARRVWGDVVRATAVLHEHGLVLGSVDPARVLLTPGGVVLPDAGWLPFYRTTRGALLGPASAEWLQLYPEPRLATAEMLSLAPPTPRGDRALLASLLGWLSNPGGAFPGGSALTWYARARAGQRWPVLGRDLEIERVLALLDDPAVPLADVAAALPEADLPLPSELIERARPWSEWLADRSVVAGALGALGEVDPGRVDVSAFLGPRTPPRRGGRVFRNVLWVVLALTLGLLALATVRRQGACNPAQSLVPGIDAPYNQ